MSEQAYLNDDLAYTTAPDTGQFETVRTAPKTHRIKLIDCGLEFMCRSDVDVLDGMARLGLRGIPIGCKGGGCGVCKVEVVSGHYHTGIMSRAHISEEEESRNQALACRLWPDSDLEIKVTGKLRKAFGLAPK